MIYFCFNYRPTTFDVLLLHILLNICISFLVWSAHLLISSGLFHHIQKCASHNLIWSLNVTFILSFMYMPHLYYSSLCSCCESFTIHFVQFPVLFILIFTRSTEKICSCCTHCLLKLKKIWENDFHFILKRL